MANGTSAFGGGTTVGVWASSSSSSSTVPIFGNTALVRTCRLGSEVFLDTRFGLFWYCNSVTDGICWKSRGFELFAVKTGLMWGTIWLFGFSAETCIDSVESGKESACVGSEKILGASLFPFWVLFSRRVCFSNILAITLRREVEPLSFAAWLVEPCGKGVVISTSAWYSAPRGRYGLWTHSICPSGSRQKCPTWRLDPSFWVLGLWEFKGLLSTHSPSVVFDDAGRAKFSDSEGGPAKKVKQGYSERMIDLISPCSWVCNWFKAFDILNWRRISAWSDVQRDDDDDDDGDNNVYEIMS